MDRGALFSSHRAVAQYLPGRCAPCALGVRPAPRVCPLCGRASRQRCQAAGLPPAGGLGLGRGPSPSRLPSCKVSPRWAELRVQAEGKLGRVHSMYDAGEPRLSHWMGEGGNLRCPHLPSHGNHSVALVAKRK